MSAKMGDSAKYHRLWGEALRKIDILEKRLLSKDIERGYLQGYKDGLGAARDALTVPLIDKFGEGCQNIPCMISIPKGQHTNGRCRCTASEYRRRVFMKLADIERTTM